MEKGDKGSTLTRMGVSGWMFLLVPAYPGCPGQTAVKWLLLFVVKALVLLTCTNGVLPNHLPVTVASDRPWTTLSVDWIYSTKRTMTQSYGWNLQQLQHSQNNNKCKDCCWCCMPDMTVTVHLIRLKAAGLEITTVTVEKKTCPKPVVPKHFRQRSKSNI